MSRPDSLLPIDEDTRPRIYPPERRSNGLPCALGLLVLLLSLTIVGLVIIIVARPDVVGLGLLEDISLTQVGFQQTSEALGGTVVALDNAAATNAQAAFDNAITLAANETTRTALENQRIGLEQAATQSVLDSLATQTAVAAANAQQATNNAIVYQQTQAAYQQTQAALDQTATQAVLQSTQSAVQLQGTQAALNQNATAAALGFATGTPSSDFLSATPPPQAVFDERFADGANEGLWTFSSVDDWGVGEDGSLLARGQTNWLLTLDATYDDYILDADLIVIQGNGLQSFNYILLNVPEADDTPGGLALELAYDGLLLRAVGLYRITRANLRSQDFLSRQSLEAIQAVQVEGPPAPDANVRVEVRGSRVIAAVNGDVLLDVTLQEAPPPGSVGVYVPTGTRIESIALLP
ncbi:MAG: hypothetical protein SF029_14935 [bacterium]|nr:hypothetical protein [bacterium]